MSGVFQRHEGVWTRRDLPTLCEIVGEEILSVETLGSEALASKLLLYTRTGADGRMSCMLFAPHGARVRVNDTWLTTGVRVLCDRDVISRPGAADIYFSTERLPEIVPFPAPQDGAPATYCARCRAEIAAGEPAVCCPACSTWHHENAAVGHNCWTYAPHCAVCEQSADLDGASYRWSPDAL